MYVRVCTRARTRVRVCTHAFTCQTLSVLHRFPPRCWLRVDNYFIWSFIGPVSFVIMVTIGQPSPTSYSANNHGNKPLFGFTLWRDSKCKVNCLHDIAAAGVHLT